MPPTSLSLNRTPQATSSAPRTTSTPNTHVARRSISLTYMHATMAPLELWVVAMSPPSAITKSTINEPNTITTTKSTSTKPKNVRAVRGDGE